MFRCEYEQWKKDAKIALTASRYSDKDADIIVNWFDTIKGSREREMIGEDRVEAYGKFHPYNNHWSLYDSMMCRLWIYAPYILEEHKNESL